MQKNLGENIYKFLTHSLSGSLASIVVVEFWTNCLICAKSTQTDFSIAHTRAAASWKKQENYYDWVIFAACSSKVIFAPSNEFRKQSWIIWVKGIDFGKWNVNYIGFQSFIAFDYNWLAFLSIWLGFGIEIPLTDFVCTPSQVDPVNRAGLLLFVCFKLKLDETPDYAA